VVTEADVGDFVGHAHDDDAAPAADIDLPPNQRIGAVIRAARENTGLTLEQVSRETKIHLSHLRAIEDMTPSLLGAPVYAKGYIRNYAKHLKLDSDLILKRYLAECAILTDPEKQEIAPPQTTRKLPVAVPVMGIVIVGLLGAAGFFFMSGGGGNQPSKPAASAAAGGPASQPGVQNAATPAVVSPPLIIVALKPARLEVRSSAGDKYVSRDFDVGASYQPRLGLGWTVSSNDGTAFEWRLGDKSLGTLGTDAGPIYAQSVDLAAKRAPIAAATPIDITAPPVVATTTPNAAATPGVTPPVAATPAPPKPRPRPAPTAETDPNPAAAPPPSTAIAPPTPASDPSLQAYPDQARPPQ
jgi:hypothetical protein